MLYVVAGLTGALFALSDTALSGLEISALAGLSFFVAAVKSISI